jgi:hypothetical protein
VLGSVAALDVCTPTPSVFFNLEARREFTKVEEWAFSEDSMKRPIHDIEAEIFERGREVMRKMLEAHIRARGQGDVGAGVEVTDGAGESVAHTHRRIQECHESTLFGDVRIERLAYHCPGEESVRPLDEQMQLPQRSFSYPLQCMLLRRVVQGPFDEAIDAVKHVTGVKIAKRSAETLARDGATDFDRFYEQRALLPPEQTASIVVGTVDGKGVPMVKDEPAKPVVRLGRGEKANKKRMATVAAVYTVKPRVRTPEEVTDSLFRPELKLVPGGKSKNHQPSERSKPEQKRVWASLEKSKDDVIQEVAKEMEVRDPQRCKQRVVVTDGERALQIRALQHVVGIVLILDLLHVLEKLWTAAHIFHGEGSPEAVIWVRERALRILRGEVSQVVKGIRQSATKRGIRGNNRKILDNIVGYLYRNRAYMRYDRYLADGLPIASGAVEGACKNLVKDRMERSGMRWKIPTAEAVLKLRALYLSGDFEEYWAFHIKQEQERLREGKVWHPIHVDEK